MAEVLDAVLSGDHRQTLIALRDHVAARIDEGVPARDLAPLVRQLRDVTAELADLAADNEGSAADELARRREARRAAARGADAAPAGSA